MMKKKYEWDDSKETYVWDISNILSPYIQPEEIPRENFEEIDFCEQPDVEHTPEDPENTDLGTGGDSSLPLLPEGVSTLSSNDLSAVLDDVTPLLSIHPHNLTAHQKCLVYKTPATLAYYTAHVVLWEGSDTAGYIQKLLMPCEYLEVEKPKIAYPTAAYTQ